MMRVLAFVCAAAVLLLSAQAASAESLGSIRVTSRNNGICDANVKQQSGYYDLTTGDAHYFYWMFESRNNPSTDPFIIWMTGGPGCSGMMALTNENGPCTVNEDGVDTSNNPYSWTNNATVLWIDQPTGTGFSYGKQKVSDEAGVAANFYDFVSQFMLANPQYAKLPFYVVGESYGGHYVPAVSEYINAQNQKIIENGLDAQIINLAGIAVGNGLTNPEIQYQFYPDMAISTNDHLPAVDNKTYERMVASVGPCVKLIQNCNAGNDQACTRAYDFCNEALMGPYESKGLNPYDMRKQCGDNPLCYNFTATDVFYNDPDVQAALGVDVKWESCNMQVNQQFGLDWMHEFQDRIVSLLASNIPVTIYAGDQDYVCNWLGNYAYVEKLDWPGQEDWSNSPVVDWVVDGSVAGTYRTSGGLTFVRVFKAGHMVPMDQPEAASDLIQTITKPGAWE